MSKQEVQFTEVSNEETGMTTVTSTVYDSETGKYKSATGEYETAWAHYQRTKTIDAVREQAFND